VAQVSDQRADSLGAKDIMSLRKTKILIVDDHAMIRERLVQLISREADLAVCGQAEDASQTLRAVEESRPDMVILDLSMNGSHGTELITDIKARHKNVLILVLSMHEESLYAERAIRAGARGYIGKHEGSDKVKQAIRSILQGELCVSKEIVARIMNKVAGGHSDDTAFPLEILSNRELGVFQLLGRGHGPSQIAEKLRLSVRTVEAYSARIREKLNLKSSSELVQYAIQLNSWKETRVPLDPPPRTGSRPTRPA
jgi:DNA-binding NarL/FixJ family response regulator